MTWASVRVLVMIAAACWGSIALLRDAIERRSKLRWYDRTIRFLGSLIMAALAVGSGYLLISGQLISK
jgi:hypothetical protein